MSTSCLTILKMRKKLKAFAEIAKYLKPFILRFGCLSHKAIHQLFLRINIKMPIHHLYIIVNSVRGNLHGNGNLLLALPRVSRLRQILSRLLRRSAVTPRSWGQPCICNHGTSLRIIWEFELPVAKRRADQNVGKAQSYVRN